METAPFFSDIAEGPDGGQAVWTKASDGVRIRVGWWRPEGEAKGTVLIFPGRTEYIEKYGRDAQKFCADGYAVLAIDWRGQGIADRLVDNPLVGHVGEFSDYQLDVQAALDVAAAAKLPRPWHLLAHSMGGCIGLRALYNGLPVNSACFSAPMWGIRLAPPTRTAAWVLSWSGSQLGFGHMFAPTVKDIAYPLAFPFEGNKLTSDEDMFAYMQRQLTAQPDLSLGGPSLHWLNRALSECYDLARKAAPPADCLTFLGEDEVIVDPTRIQSRMESWTNGELVMLPKARHEVLMETPETREVIFAKMLPFLDAHRSVKSAPAISA